MKEQHLSRQPPCLLNTRNEQVIADRVVTASSFFKRLRGLLGRRGFNPGEALILPSCHAVHMLFMRFPIDIVFCDVQYKVVRICKHLKPWMVSPYVAEAFYAIELTAGSIEDFDIRVGDKLQLCQMR